jgi:hypothetical protein
VRSLTTRLETTTLERNIANAELLRFRASLTASQEEHAAYVKARQAELDAQSKVGWCTRVVLAYSACAFSLIATRCVTDCPYYYVSWHTHKVVSCWCVYVFSLTQAFKHGVCI